MGRPRDKVPISHREELHLSQTLFYPLETEPKTGDGSAVSIAPGVFWLRMPLGGALPWINVWALADEEGFTVIDTGIRSPEHDLGLGGGDVR